MTNYFKLKIFSVFYYFLLLLILVLISKFVVDFYEMNKKTIIVENNNFQENNDEIIEPRMQFQDNDTFNYIQAQNGYLGNKDDYIFENVKMTGDYGTITSGRLDVLDNKNILEFTIDPVFTIDLMYKQ